MMALSLNDATSPNCWLKTKCIKFFKINIRDRLPVWKEKFHSCYCYTLNSLKITHIRICLILNNLVKQHSVYILGP